MPPKILPRSFVFAVFLALPACETSPAGPGSEDPEPPPDAAGDVDPADGTGAAEGPGLGLDYAALEAGVVPRWEPESEDWTGVPWPTDRDRKTDGTIDLSRFPNPDVDLLDAYLAFGSEVLHGFGLNGSIYFQLSGSVDVGDLPLPAVTLGDPKSPAQLVNATPESARFGERVPVVFDFDPGSNDPYLLPNTLSMRPVFGFPLAEGETYCALLTRGLVDAAGKHLAPAPAFSAALETDPHLEALRTWLPASQLLAEDLAVATCFTTDTATLELRRVRAFLDTIDPPALVDVEFTEPKQYWAELRGHYLAPNFQAGAKPYAEVDGDLRFDEAGDPVVQTLESIRFLLHVPNAFPMPAAGWPLVLYGHGTGGDWESCQGDVVPDLTQLGLAVACIDQPLHGERGEPDYDVELLSFNFQNPKAGRTNFRQSAIDVMNLARFAATGGLDLDPSESGFGKDIAIDPAGIHVFGHSHGGLGGAIAMGVDPVLKGAVLSGAGGVFIETIMKRKDYLDLHEVVAVVADVEPEELDTFHPVLTLVQTLVDATDPVNYAPYWFRPAPGGASKHVFATTGTEDEATPTTTSVFLAAAARMPLVDPIPIVSPAHALLGLDPAILPLTRNIKTPQGEKRTGALRQWLGGTHFVAFQSPQARKMWRSFFTDLAIGADPILDD